MEVQIVCISGKMGSGKDTTALALQSKLERQPGTYCKFLKFADPLYAMQDAIYDVGIQFGIFKERAKKDGKLLQVLGTEWGRSIDQNIWVKAFHGALNNTIGEAKESGKVERLVVLITDCRFENEFLAMGTLNGAMRVRLECPKEVRKARADCWREDDTHASEVGLDNIASEGLFDLYLDTNKFGIDACAKAMEFKLAGPDFRNRILV